MRYIITVWSNFTESSIVFPNPVEDYSFKEALAVYKSLLKDKKFSNVRLSQIVKEIEE